ncbi:MAG: NAD(P)/FAD-dependent oxidoreductase [Phycisphaerales bacterium]
MGIRADVWRVVILGGGFAGAYCARALARRLRGTGVEVLLLDRNNFFVFSPLLVEAGTGSLEPRHAVVSIRAMIGSASFRLGEVSGLDVKAREVVLHVPELEREERIRYDHAVIALGSITRLPDVPGLREHGLGMKSTGDAVAMRDRAIRMLELADAAPDAGDRRALLHFVVVGGNFTGAEVAGELHAFLLQARRLYRNIGAGDIAVTLVERSERILAAIGPELGDYAAAKMRARGIDVLTRESATRIDATRVVLESGRVLDTRTVIWCAGIAPPPAIAAMPLPLDERGYILCERDLRVKGFDNVWGIGDCAVNTDAAGKPYPATAQHGLREGIACAANIARVLAGRPTRPCDLVDQGSLAALGCRTGVARVFGFKIAGFWAWWLWRTVYLLKMPGIGRKMRVAMDWTLDLLFPRDYVQLGVHRAEEWR